tara:strand:- start:34 stop:330 length:297 start_codon:yes stop_codon:yes gene_type:complete
MQDKIKISLYFCHSSSYTDKAFMIPQNITIKDFLMMNNTLLKDMGLNFKDLKYGIFGKIVDESYVLKLNDRIEVYKPAKVDPKNRRLLIAKNKKKKNN